MSAAEKVRIDKWLWAVRIYKTRSQATEACKMGRIIISGMEVKPSREVKPGDTVFVRKLPVIYTIRVKCLVENRLPAQRVKEFVDDLTSPEELEIILFKTADLPILSLNEKSLILAFSYLSIISSVLSFELSEPISNCNLFSG